MPHVTPHESPPPATIRYRIAMRELIGERFGALWRTIPAAIAGDDPEAVHDVRVASRRLRAAMDVAVDCFPGRWFKLLASAVKEITRTLGAVRDREVQLAFLRAEREAAPVVEHPGLDRLIDRLEREHEIARQDMVRFFADLEWRGIPAKSVKYFGQAAKGPHLVVPSTGTEVAS